MDREMLLQQSYDVYDSDTTKARNLINKMDYKNDHYLLQCIAQTYFNEAKFDKNGK